MWPWGIFIAMSGYIKFTFKKRTCNRTTQILTGDVPVG